MDDFHKCGKCLPEDHEDWACRCEDRNIRVAKERRKRGITWIKKSTRSSESLKK
jgi:hypothetical protein